MRRRRRRGIVLDDSYPRTRERDFDDAPAPTIRASRAPTLTIEGELPPADPDKPPYRVPLMEEIAAVPWNGYRVATLFAGCGGSSLGYRMAGFHVVYANEFVEHAAETYRANARPGTLVDLRDIRDVKGTEILEHVRGGELDVLDGSPPCQPFSTSGARDRTWGLERQYGDHVQRADDLFYEYARLVEECRPRVFVAENVTGLVKGTAKGYFKLIHARLRGAGYRVQARVVDAQWLGVPQARQRVIFVGVRDDLGQDPRFPLPLPYRYSMADALPHLRAYKFDNSGNFHYADRGLDEPVRTITISGGAAAWHHKVEGDPVVELEYGPNNRREHDTDEPAPTVMARGIGGVREYQATLPGDGAALEGYAIAEEYDRLGIGEISRKYLNLVRPDPEAPSNTITAAGGTSTGTASVVHPTERRKFYIAELLRLCGFPDDFAMHGSYTEQWARLGNSVPPPMMAAVAREVAAILDGCP